MPKFWYPKVRNDSPLLVNKYVPTRRTSHNSFTLILHLVKVKIYKNIQRENKIVIQGCLKYFIWTIRKLSVYFLQETGGQGNSWFLNYMDNQNRMQNTKIPQRSNLIGLKFSIQYLKTIININGKHCITVSVFVLFN